MKTFSPGEVVPAEANEDDCGPAPVSVRPAEAQSPEWQRLPPDEKSKYDKGCQTQFAVGEENCI